MAGEIHVRSTQRAPQLSNLGQSSINCGMNCSLASYTRPHPPTHTRACPLRACHALSVLLNFPTFRTLTPGGSGVLFVSSSLSGSGSFTPGMGRLLKVTSSYSRLSASRPHLQQVRVHTHVLLLIATFWILTSVPPETQRRPGYCRIPYGLTAQVQCGFMCDTVFLQASLSAMQGLSMWTSAHQPMHA